MKTVIRADLARLCLARRSAVASLVLAASLGSACSTTGGSDPLAGYNAAFESGDYAAAAASLEPEAEAGSAERDVLRLLHRAEAQRLAGDYRGAIESYRKAEGGLKLVDTEGVGERALEGAAAAVGANGDYEPYEAEKILINTYLALSHLSLGEDDAAGVQFQRAANRTERAIDSFASELAAARDKKLEIAGKSIEFGDAFETAGFEAQSEPAGHDTFEGYDRFMVPAANYLYGIYSMGLRDPSDADTAAFMLRAVSETHPTVELFEREFDEAEAARQPGGPMVWVMYENGRAPALQDAVSAGDMTVDLDNFGFDLRSADEDRTAWQNGVQASGLNPYVLAYALPEPTEPKLAGPLRVEDSAGESIELAPFSAMGSVRETEFEKRRPAMKRFALAEAAVKVAAQALAAREVEKKAAGFGGFAARFAGNATAATTSADTRSWTSLPSHWEVARLARPADGALSLDGTAVELPTWQRTLVYVKRPSAGAPLRASLIDLDGRETAIEIGL